MSKSSGSDEFPVLDEEDRDDSTGVIPVVPDLAPAPGLDTTTGGPSQPSVGSETADSSDVSSAADVSTEPGSEGDPEPVIDPLSAVEVPEAFSEFESDVPPEERDDVIMSSSGNPVFKTYNMVSDTSSKSRVAAWLEGRRARARLAAADRREFRRDRRRWRRMKPFFSRAIPGLGFVVFFAIVAGMLAGSVGFFIATTRFQDRLDSIEAQSLGSLSAVETAGARINRELDVKFQQLEDLGVNAEREGVVVLPTEVSQSVWLLETSDASGATQRGSAFVVASSSQSSFFVTSFSLVAESTETSGPQVLLIKGSERMEANLYRWDESKDLALLEVSVGSLPALRWEESPTRSELIGTQVFTASGFGTLGSTVAPGRIVDVSQIGVQIVGPLGTFYRGGPVLTVEGNVVAVAASGYTPFGDNPGEVHFYPTVDDICGSLLDC